MKVSNFHFHSRLVLEWPIGEDNEFVVLEPFRVSFFLDDEPISWTVPAGTKTDLASIPEIVPKWIAQKVAKHVPAAVVHDELCRSRPWTSRVAADIFNEAMKTLGVETLMRIAMWRAVIRFGPKWDLENKED